MKRGQINNIQIHERARPAKGEKRFFCKAPTGSILEDFSTIGGAKDWAERTLDFVERPRHQPPPKRPRSDYGLGYMQRRGAA